MTTGMRHIPLEGADNVRDVGGYATADGRLTKWKACLRSDSLDALTSEAQQQLLAYGVRTFVDLRSEAEVADKPNVFASSTVARYRHVPMWTDPADAIRMPVDLATGYRELLNRAQTQILKVMHALLEADAFPVLVHCAVGKDRTGVIIALLLDLAGVTDALIAEDYALSTVYLAPKFEVIRQAVMQTGQDFTAMEPLLRSEPETMISTLHYLDERYGGAAGYLRLIGLSDVQIDTLKSALID